MSQSSQKDFDILVITQVSVFSYKIKERVVLLSPDTKFLVE